MSRRVLIAITLVTSLALLAFGIPLAFAARIVYRKDAIVRLEREVARAAIEVPASSRTNQDPVELPQLADGTHFALYDVHGQKLTGEGPKVADDAVFSSLTGKVSDSYYENELVVAAPVTSEEQVFAVIRAAVPMTETHRLIRRAWLAMVILGGGVIAAATGLAYWESRRLARPVKALASTAARLGDGDFTARAEPSGIDEVDQVGASLNTTAKRLGDLLARERAFSADASHQLTTPLTALRLHFDSAMAEPEPGRAQAMERAIEQATDNLDRIEATVEDLLCLARDVSPVREKIDLAELIGETEETWRRALASGGRRFEIDLDPFIPTVNASASALRNIVDVLVSNASIHGAGTVTVSTRATPGGIAIDVSDEGPGPKVDQKVLFERRSPTAAGNGIGLALARSLAESEGGRLVLSSPGPNPCFTLLLKS